MREPCQLAQLKTHWGFVLKENPGFDIKTGPCCPDLFTQCFRFRTNRPCALTPPPPEFQDASAQQETTVKASNGSVETRAEGGRSSGRGMEEDSDTKRCSESCCQVIKCWITQGDFCAPTNWIARDNKGCSRYVWGNKAASMNVLPRL